MSKNDAFKNDFLLKEFFFLKRPSILKSIIKKTNILERNLFTIRVLLYNQSIIPSTDVIQLTLTLKMIAQVVETSVNVNVNNNSSIQDYGYSDDETQPTFEMTPGFKPFT